MRKRGVFHVVKQDLTIVTSTPTTMITEALTTMIQVASDSNNHARRNEKKNRKVQVNGIKIKYRSNPTINFKT